MYKRGQFRLSFSMIFSIILIISIIAISVYVLLNFLSVGSCTEVGLFYDGLQNEVNKAWKSTIYKDFFDNGKLPRGIEFACFGDLTDNYNGKHEEQFDSLSKYRNQDKNAFLYPTSEACDSKLATFELDSVEIEGFFCVPVINGKIELKMERGELDALVKIKEV
mgnify:CR=1 FL=1